MIRRSAVSIVIGTGGYVSAPAVLGARLARRPSLLVEPNAGAGLANRWLSRWASGAAVAYAQTLDQMRCPAWVTGVPVREEFFRVRPLSTAETPDTEHPRILLVLGGSQGARQLNLSLPPALKQLEEDLPGLRVVHQCGARHLEETREAYEEAGLASAEVEVLPFLEEMAKAMEKADLLVSRAGALTTAEIAAAGRPALLVPLAIAAGHQVDNARVLADAGAARILESAELTPDTLARALADLLADGRRLEAMGRAARGLAQEGSAAQIADRVEELAASREGAA
jgi:UDP-N-acetylglucosamine--N-acetylmuramyl-(pentapeptide) pyrophosphoryl-undecaprenol N-acetylglucosamine transferase